MNTTFWGPDGWKFLHILTFIYPEKPNQYEKEKMKHFMNSIRFILPCKYCRLIFTKYMKSLPIDDYLDSRDLCIEWLYKIHNKVNKKLRIQGFCKHSNPDLVDVKAHYKKITEPICEIMATKKKDIPTKIKNVIHYICNSGSDFLGSIVFNYQGYFSNCHTINEKTIIVLVYEHFFNSIIPLICCYLENFCKDNTFCMSKYTKLIPKFKIRTILSQDEPYTKLIKWFYKCNDLCTMKDKYTTEEKYEAHFNKHIVASCANPKLKKGKTIKSCRAAFSKKAAPKTIGKNDVLV